MYRRRTISRRARVEFPSDLGSFANSIAAPGDVARPELAGLSAALSRIPDAQRRAIVLREWHGLSHSEVAAELGITRTAAETLIFRARRRLATELTESDGRREQTKRSMLSLLWMKCVGFGSGTKLAAGLVLATTVAGSLDHGAFLRLSAPQARPANPRPVLVGRATPAHGSVEPATRRTVHAFRLAARRSPPLVVQAAVGVTPLLAVVQTPPAVTISYPSSPDVPVEPADPVLDDRGTAAVTGDPTPPQTDDPVVVPLTVPPTAPGPPDDPDPLPQDGGDAGGTPAPDPASPPGHGVGPKHAAGDPTVPSLPPTASPAAHLALACRRSDAEGRSLAAASRDSAGDGTSAEPACSASDPSSGDATGDTDREHDPLVVVVKRAGDALLGGGVK